MTSMKFEKVEVRNSASEEYAALYVYLHGATNEIDIDTRPMIIVCPGGAYAFTSDREAEIIAMQFLAFGYHAAVLRYSVAPARFPTAFLELGRSVALIREHAREWHVNPEEIAVLGFSAGGHLAGSFCTLWYQEWVAERLGVAWEMLRPNAMILGYPVITSGKYAHVGSFRNLLGKEYEEKRTVLSLENCVDENTPRAFIWHTFGDRSVPVQNSLLFVDALASHGIPVEFHLFEKGVHGLSLANRLTKIPGGMIGAEPSVAVWIDLVHTWIEGWIA